VQSEYDPSELAMETEKVVVRGDMRKYYRLSWASKCIGSLRALLLFEVRFLLKRFSKGSSRSDW